MSFTTWIYDPNIQIKNLVLTTKNQSYQFGRRLYSFHVDETKYWLKYHEAKHHQILEHAFLDELDFYRHSDLINQNILLPHQIIQLNQFVCFNELINGGYGLILIDTHDFFTDIRLIKDIEMIKHKINLVLDVLSDLHESGWIHGDLKPEHFRSYDDLCKLIDFEQAHKQGVTAPNLNATPHYMAPELFHGQQKTVQTDLYALGLILYEWLIHSKLTAKTYRDWALLHCQQLHIQLPSHFLYFLPLIEGLLMKNFEQRFSSVIDARKCINAIKLL